MIASVSHAEPSRLGRRIVRLFRPHRGVLALIILTILTTSALSVISALLVRQVFDKALFVRNGPNLGALYPLVAVLIAIPIINAPRGAAHGARGVTERVQRVASLNAVNDLRPTPTLDCAAVSWS